MVNLRPASGRFECADYMDPTDRLSEKEKKVMFFFFEKILILFEKPLFCIPKDIVDWIEARNLNLGGGRYGFAYHLKKHGPRCLKDVPIGFVIELVQLLLNRNILEFKGGRVVLSLLSSERAIRLMPSSMYQDFKNILEGRKLDMPAKPTEILSVLCTLETPASRYPVYHYEKFGEFHAPSWICICTLKNRETHQPLCHSFISKPTSRKYKATEDAVRRVLHCASWPVYLKQCAQLQPSVVTAAASRMPECIVGPALTRQDLRWRETTVRSILTKPPKNALASLDVLRAALSQIGVVYETRVVASGICCSVKLNFKERSNVFLFSFSNTVPRVPAILASATRPTIHAAKEAVLYLYIYFVSYNLLYTS